MKNWLRRRKLVSLVQELAIYNDKGIEWKKHGIEQVENERNRLISLICSQINVVGRQNISPALLAAIDNGNIRTDITGKYIEYAKMQKL